MLEDTGRRECDTGRHECHTGIHEWFYRQSAVLQCDLLQRSKVSNAGVVRCTDDWQVRQIDVQTPTNS